MKIGVPKEIKPQENRIGLKVSLRAKWHNSKAPALQMALMKKI